MCACGVGDLELWLVSVLLSISHLPPRPFPTLSCQETPTETLSWSTHPCLVDSMLATSIALAGCGVIVAGDACRSPWHHDRVVGRKRQRMSVPCMRMTARGSRRAIHECMDRPMDACMDRCSLSAVKAPPSIVADAPCRLASCPRFPSLFARWRNYPKPGAAVMQL